MEESLSKHLAAVQEARVPAKGTGQVAADWSETLNTLTAKHKKAESTLRLREAEQSLEDARRKLKEASLTVQELSSGSGFHKPNLRVGEPILLPLLAESRAEEAEMVVEREERRLRDLRKVHDETFGQTPLPEGADPQKAPETTTQAEGRPSEGAGNEKPNVEGTAQPLSQAPTQDTDPEEALEKSLITKRLAIGAIEAALLQGYVKAAEDDLAKRNEEAATEEGVQTRLTAAAAMLPRFAVAQPVLVQSFSLRNFFQLFNPNSDPTDVRTKVRSELLANPVLTLDGISDQAGQYDLTRLSGDQIDLLVDSIAQKRLESRWFHTRLDIITLDIGLSAPGLTIGDTSEDFENHVDHGFPMFFVGTGFHIKAFEVSGGVCIYRNEQEPQDIRETFYVALSIDLFKTSFNLGGSTPLSEDTNR